VNTVEEGSNNVKQKGENFKLEENLRKGKKKKKKREPLKFYPP
jgi:hypothetical protein